MTLCLLCISYKNRGKGNAVMGFLALLNSGDCFMHMYRLTVTMVSLLRGF
jgi:hypothetical protein